MTERPARPWVKVVHYGVFVLLLAGGALYFLLKPPMINPLSDPGAAEAMALVQTHRAQQAPTIRQAITDRVKALAESGKGVRLGEWRVEREGDDLYVVRISIREQTTVEWFERNYLWRVNVPKRSVVPLTLPASSVMPLEEGGQTDHV